MGACKIRWHTWLANGAERDKLETNCIYCTMLGLVVGVGVIGVHFQEEYQWPITILSITDHYIHVIYSHYWCYDIKKKRKIYCWFCWTRDHVIYMVDHILDIIDNRYGLWLNTVILTAFLPLTCRILFRLTVNTLVHTVSAELQNGGLHTEGMNYYRLLSWCKICTDCVGVLHSAMLGDILRGQEKSPLVLIEGTVSVQLHILAPEIIEIPLWIIWTNLKSDH